MYLRIDPLSADPIFEQIAFQVKSAIARGEVAAEARLPSVRDLARELSINPNTVVRAYDALEAEGVVARRQGSGCYVTGRASVLSEEERLRQLNALIEQTITQGFHLGFSAAELRKEFGERLRGIAFSRRSSKSGASSKASKSDDKDKQKRAAGRSR